MTKEEGMTCTQFLNIIATKRAEGWDDKKILDFLFHLFTTENITAVELKMLVQAIGYDLSDEFIKELDKEGIEH